MNLRLVVMTTAAVTLMMPLSGTMQQPANPKLLVVLVVDQMRADYLAIFNQHWKGGFRTLLDEGAVFEEAEYPYINTITCAGHTTVGTGTFPRTHGMVLNDWWHREERRTRGCTDDEASPLVTYGRPAKLGNSAKRLLVPTLADELRTQKPGSRVVALSLKARSAIGLAGHGGDVVTWFDDAAGSFVTSTAFAPRPVKAMQDFIERDPYEKDQGKIWTLKDPPDTYRARDAGVGERPLAPWTGLFPHRIAGRAPLDALFFEIWQASPFSDAYLQRMAAAMVESLAIGQRDGTDFLAVGFSALDEVGHSFGPGSREIEDLLRWLDETTGALISHLDARVGRNNYVLALTADHGVAPIAEFQTSGRIAPQDVGERVEETLTAEFGRLEKGTYVDAVNFSYLYFAPTIFDRLRASPAAMRAVEKAILDIPGVARVLRSDRLSETSADRFVRAAALNHVAGRSGDLVILPKQNWYYQGRTATSATSHGTLYSYDTQVPVILLGAGIKPSHIKERVTPADIAPTLAQLAGVRMPKAEGRVLREALR